MNLINWFNFNYFKENIKKSKSFLIFFLGIIPIINILMLILNSNKEVYIPSLETLSIFNYPLCYIIPVIISICLFGYVFKKKSVDFVNSMPISRRSIFITNTIGGIALILLLNLINSIIILILSIFISNICIPINMIIDYFIVWSIIYIFIFVISNLAVSLSGNMITSIALTLLILFLIPFLHSYISLKSIYLNPINYSIVNSEFNNIKVILETNYTAGYNFIFSIFANDQGFKLFNIISIIKMIILSIIYIVVGYFVFKNRKMEVSETSFKNIYVHNTIKCLTMIPLVILFYEVSNLSDLITTIILLVVMIAYYFIFDLITRRNITKLLINIVFFISFVIISVIILTITNKIIENKDININSNDIESISFNTYKYDNAYNYSSILKNIEITDKNIINEVIKNNSNYNTCDDYNDIVIKLKNNKKYSMYVCLDNIDISSYESVYKTFYNIDFNNVYGFNINNKLIDDNIKDIIKNTINSIDIDSKLISEGNDIDAYTYIDHKLIKYSFNANMSKELEKIYVDTINKEVVDNIDKINIYSINYYDAYIDNPNNLIKVKEIIKANPKVDINKEYITINIYTDIGVYKFNTNEIDKIRELLDD